MCQVPRRLLDITPSFLSIYQFSVQREYKKIPHNIIELQVPFFSLLNPHVCYHITMKQKQHVVYDFFFNRVSMF